MSFPLILLILLSTLLLLTYRFIIYPLFLSPLRHIPPAHPTSPLSSLWISHHRRNGAQALSPITNAHKKHGTIIRLSPNELSISSLEAANHVYIEKGGFAKPGWWAKEFMSYGVRNMVSMQGGARSKEHAGRKRDMGSVYAKSALLRSEELVRVAEKCLTRFEDVLKGVVDGEEDGVLDVYYFNGAATADLASAYLFGSAAGTDFLRDRAARDEYFRNHDVWLKGQQGYVQAQKWLEDFGFRRCRAAQVAVGDEEKSGEEAVVYRQLRSRGLTGNDMASETLDHFIAGAEAPRTTLTYLEWELSKRPAMQKRLQNELLCLASKATNNASRVPDLKALDALPLLDAVLTETLRVYTPSPGPQYRITPPEGTTLHGFFIPGGTQISASLKILHRNSAVFPDPDSWEPERWMIDDVEKLEEMRRWFWAFSKGSRICIGKDFVLIVMKLIIAAMYSRYETEVVEDEGMEQEDRFLAGPVSEKLVLRFQAVR